ncbi:hypothetical protein [Rossellomorea yichunensis]|uniref:hypothetical protein n=1 Tax=Rossellomorea yichunensis TaxID=3077331 RepID=UPI0028DE7265|nr:hypothetical protein [Rossellomorea sp. YC4-1]MDT9025685.1 hypothetical protein [Rossellomorea sp. YC4-1]
MEINEILTFTIAFASISLLLVTILTTRVNKSKYNNYDMEKDIARLNDMRHYYEEKIHELNKKLMYTEDRWKDVNHLLVTEQKINNNNTNSVNSLSNFLKKHGLTEKDLIIDKKSVFVLTPFIKSELPFFQRVNNTCNQVGLNCSRGDEEYISGDILPHILKKICKARLIIVNIDGRNPNVFYELGIAHALDKPVILTTKSINNTPFDLQSKNIIQYSTLEDLENALKLALTRTVLENE